MNLKIASIIMLFVFTCFNSKSQKKDARLENKISDLIAGFNGKIGIYVHDLKKNRTVKINSDTIFPTASMIKIPICTGIMDKINKNELQYHQELIYKDSLLYAGVDLLGSFKNNEKIELSKVMMLMLTMSDNTASLWLQSLAGGGFRINQIMDSIGLKFTRVNSRTLGRQSNQELYGWGQTTPFEMGLLMEMIVNGTLLNSSTSSKMLRLLGRNYWDEEAISQIPSDVFIASKSGAVDQTRNEVLFVNSKKCRYVFCICTKDNKDQSWTDTNEAWVLTRKISKLLWEYYN